MDYLINGHTKCLSDDRREKVIQNHPLVVLTQWNH